MENWNKNVRKKNLNNSNEKLNLNSYDNLNNNSNLNPTQNTNKNNNQRDYDKEPIIIKDNNPKFALIIAITTLPIIIAIFLFAPLNANKIIKGIFVVPFLLFPIFYEFMRNKREIIFKNNSIEYVINSKIQRSINLNEITDIRKSADIRYEYFQRTPLIAVFLLGLYLILAFMVKGYVMILAILSLLIIILLSNFIAKIVFSSFYKNKFRYFDRIVIYGKIIKEFINILPENENERDEIEKYCLEKLKTNIKMIDKKIFIFFNKK
ncbi:MAG: hypothetical protein IJP87_05120 [Campylobacter sp.]|nr:hypothetical protein [Campylobacter sp.]